MSAVMSAMAVSRKWEILPPSQEYLTLPASVREQIDEFLSEHPVRLGALAERLGIKVRISNLPRAISSRIGEDDGEFVIHINRHQARHRQRFVLAHEIAHFLLHKDKIIADGGWSENFLLRSGKQPKSVDYAANRLAFDLVTPSKLIAKAMAHHVGPMTDEVIEDLAGRFDVSKTAIKVKLQTK